jgi:hypothetical protein
MSPASNGEPKLYRISEAQGRRTVDQVLSSGLWLDRRIAKGGRNVSKYLQSALVASSIATCLFLANRAFAQVNTADIVGTVTDAADAVVPNAKITVENQTTREVRTTVTSGSGDYVVNLLPSGPYVVSVEAPSFKKTSITVALSAGDRARVDARLQVGDVTQVVQIEAQAPALQTDSASLRTVVTSEAVQDLPLNGRNFVTLVQGTVGVGVGPSNSILSGTRPDERRQTANITANGRSVQQPDDRWHGQQLARAVHDPDAAFDRHDLGSQGGDQ